MKPPLDIDIARVIDSHKVGIFQLGVFILCFTCLLLDGFDAQAISYVGPAVSRELHISNQQLGVVFSALPLGVLFGSILSGMIADRIGRRPVVVASMAATAPLTLVYVLVGGVPGAIALALVGVCVISTFGVTMVMAQEYLPHRIGMASGLSIGLSIGLGGIAAVGLGALADSVDLRSAMYTAAAAPLAGLVLALFLPSSRTQTRLEPEPVL